MIKTLFVGLWSGGVALGAVYLAMMLNAEKPAGGAHGGEEGPQVVEFVKSETMSVPVIRGGKVIGYVVTELSFAVSKSEGGEAEANAPLPYLVDAAYRSIYENVSADFEHLKPQDLKTLSETVKKTANERLGKETVKDVLISNINFVGQDELRTNWVKQNH